MTAPRSLAWHGLPAGDIVCSVRPIVQSSLVLIESEWLSEGSSEATRRPSFVFLIHHPVTGEYIVWDLGIRRDVKQHFPDPSLDKFEAHFEEEVTDSLQRVNVSPDQVKKVLISHKHWDHTGDPSLFPEAAFYVGADDLEGLSALKQESEKGRVVPVWFGADDTKHPVAAFDDSSDLYGDGSVLIVDAHGHTPGHINLLVRTGKDEYVLLASDGCHHTLLLSPEAEHAHRTFGKFRAYGEDESVEPSHQFYEDVHAAQRHLEGLRACQARKDVLVVIAHNEEQWKRWFGGERYGVGPDLADWRSKGLDG